MFEVDGKQLTLQEVQAAADQNQLSLDEYKQKFNVKEAGDPPTKQDSIHISREDFEQYEGDKVEEAISRTVRRMKRLTAFARGSNLRLTNHSF